MPDARSGLASSAARRGSGRPPRATALRGDVRARARERGAAGRHQGELDRHRASRRASRLRRRQDLRRAAAASTASIASSGLWTSTAYHGSPRDIPVLRRKVERVIEHFGLDPTSHDGKAVLNVLETYPRDELFQASVAGSDPHRARRGQSVRAAHGATARAPRSVSPLLLVPGVRAARPLQHRGAPAHRADRARRLRRHQRREPRADFRLEPRAPARGGAHRSRPAPPAGLRRASSGASAPRRSPGPTGCARC